MRLTWLTLPFTAGALLADAFTGRSTAVQAVAAAICWGAWLAALIGLLLRRPLALTVLRCVAPLALAGAVWASAVSDRTSGAVAALAVMGTAVPVVLAFLPEVGAWLVNGAAYGDERRYPLRAPGAVLAGPLALSWIVLAAGVLAGPFLLAAGQWIPGAVAVVAGAPAVYVTGRALHSLSLRWAVLVPAGLVLKDHVTLLDPVLVERRQIELLHAAPADTDALDLTARAPGVALEARLEEKVDMTILVDGRRQEHGKSARFLFTPTRPGALLADAASRRIRVG
jgi:hypothetical protein